MSIKIKNIFLSFFCALFLINCQSSHPQPYDLYLLVGQSNMAGRGIVEPIDKTPHPRVLMLNKQNKWVMAVNPLHFDKPDYVGTGLDWTGT